MQYEDFHCHSTFSDGIHTPEDMVLSAIEKGMKRIGFSEHGYAYYDPDCCIKKDSIAKYQAEICRLKEKYTGAIEIFCGIEQDYYSTEPADGFDYIIGSVHYLFLGGRYFAVDDTPKVLQEACDRFFSGDWYSLAEEYFHTVGEVAEKTGCDIIGHFDLVSKLNERKAFFDENHPRYEAAWKSAADRLLAAERVFEINTGAISRGYRCVPYPAPPMISYLAERGARFILSSDSHSAGNLVFGFDEWAEKYKRLGADIIPFRL